MNPIALHAVLNCLAEVVHLAEGEPDEVRSRQAQDALWEAAMAADNAFPAGSREAEALLTVLSAVSAFARTADPRFPAGAEAEVKA